VIDLEAQKGGTKNLLKEESRRSSSLRSNDEDNGERGEGKMLSRGGTEEERRVTSAMKTGEIGLRERGGSTWK